MMATGQDFVKNAVNVFIGFWGVKWKASLSLTSKDGKITLSFTTPLGHLVPHLNPLQPHALMLWLLDLQLLNLQLQDLLILDLHLLTKPPATGPPVPGSPAHGLSAHGPAREGLIKAKPQ